MGKNDIAWNKLEKKHNIVQKVKLDGSFIITANDIREFREPRLMTKFDFKTSLPELFKDNNLSILPITRGKYIISNFNAYEKIQLEDNLNIDYSCSVPNYIQSIDFSNITSEAIALNSAFISNIISNFIEEENLFPTINGRMSSGDFTFNIKNSVLKKSIPINVSSSQIEIDASYETKNSFTLVEAKNSIPKTFIIRQIYYPYRLWYSKLNKKINNIFFTYTNGIFNLSLYDFHDYMNYNSIYLKKQKSYSINKDLITNQDIDKILNNISLIDNTIQTFPQADSFERVINLCENLNDNNEMTKDQITLNYSFDSRQTNYYTDAGIYLNYIEKKKIKNEVIFKLSNKGLELFNLSYKNRQLHFINDILKNRIFYESFMIFKKTNNFPSKKKIANIIKKNKTKDSYSESTCERRASTVSGWLKWIIKITK